MAFRLNEFKTNLTGEGARPTLFDVELIFPSGPTGIPGIPGTLPIPIPPGLGISGGITEPLKKLKFTCKAAQLPGKTLGVIEVPYFGRKIKVAGDQTFAEWTITVINDEDFVTRNAFESWMSSINQHNSNLRTNQFYHSTAKVTQYAKSAAFGSFSTPIKSYKFEGVWPSDLSPIDVSWESNDTIEEYTVTLNYNWWESSTTDDFGITDAVGVVAGAVT